MSNERVVAVVSGIVVAVAIAAGGWKVSTGIGEAVGAQAKALDNLRTWKAAYQALLPVQARWKESFEVAAEHGRQDLVGIGQSLRLSNSGLKFDINTLRSDRVEAVVFEGAPVGLLRTCVAGGDQSGLQVSAETMRGMIKGITSMVRHDIELNRLDISSKDGKPVATLGGLCVLARKEA
ncbi:hypothetical protein [Pseudomonas aeruginosa]|uniref:hypothetical protein n=1 Tax=Pseudomonas aeruginosa TaxID=287 RepID=UPI0039EBC78D